MTYKSKLLDDSTLLGAAMWKDTKKFLLEYLGMQAGLQDMQKWNELQFLHVVDNIYILNSVYEEKYY